MLNINNLTVRRGDKDVLQDLSLSVAPGELVALVGPNGVGKSTLALTLFGHPSCGVVKGELKLDDVDLATLKTHERVKLGLFLSHQEPPSLPGVALRELLRVMLAAVSPEPVSTPVFFDRLRASLSKLHLPDDFADKFVNDNLSGGEKKRSELLTLLMAAPRYAVLDELDSGMDAVARSLAQDAIADLRAQGTGFLVISHNDQFVHDLQPTRVITLL